MNTFTKKLLLCIGGLLILLGASYFAISIYYKDAFLLNTWINDVYCTGKTISDVNEVLSANTAQEDSLYIIGYDGIGKDCKENTWSVSFADLERSFSYEDSLNEYMAHQNSWTWPFYLLHGKELQIEPVITVNEELLQNWWNEISSVSDVEEAYEIQLDKEQGYILFDSIHNRLDTEKAYALIKDTISSGGNEVNLIAADCYYDVPLTAKQKETRKLFEQIQAYQSQGPVYDLRTESVQIPAAKMAGFLQKSALDQIPVLDDNNQFMIEKSEVQKWIMEFAQEYDTYEKNWSFESTRGDVVDVKGVTFGVKLHQKKETEWLSDYLDSLCTGGAYDRESHIPQYAKGEYLCSGTEIGNTYVEVDMGEQKLYYYVKGELKLSTDIVTGNMRRRMGTPEGLNYVYNKQKNRTLRGPGYATPVKFWMPVKGAIGIHDAKWRDEFGGEIYKTNGSHGCVNIPVDVAEKLYDMIEIGTPVVMFYGDDPYDEEAKTN